MTLVVKSEILKLAKKSGLRVSKELAETLEKNVLESLKKALARARSNKRTTLMPQDI